MLIAKVGNLLRAITCLLASLIAVPAYGDFFTEDFSSLTGTSVDAAPFPNSSERGNGLFSINVAIPGWTLEGDPTAILGFSRSGDLAVVLNEQGGPNGLSRSLTGLSVGTMYRLRFEYWGDNVPGTYSFSYEVNGSTSTINGTSTGLNLGTFNTLDTTFIASNSTTTLRFLELNDSPSSPVIDNITISAVPEPSSMVLVSLATVLVSRFRRLRKS